MGDSFKKDSILKMVITVFLGLVVFSFLFSLLFGGSGVDATMNQHAAHHGGMSAGVTGGTMMIGIIPGLFQFLIQMLMLVLVISLIGGLFIGVSKLFKDQEIQGLKISIVESLNNNPILKVLAVTILGLFGLYFITGILNSIAFGFSPMFMIIGLINLVIKILILAFVVFGGIALWKFFKNQL